MKDSAEDKRRRESDERWEKMKLGIQRLFYRDAVAMTIWDEDICDPPPGVIPGEGHIFVIDRPRLAQIDPCRFRYRKQEYALTCISAESIDESGQGAILELRPVKDVSPPMYYCLCPNCAPLVSWRPGAQCIRCNDIIPPQPCPCCEQEANELHRCSECDRLSCRDCLDVHEHVDEPETDDDT